MGLFGRRKKEDIKTYDREKKVPAIRASICTGEQVAGFQNIENGKFEEVMLIRDAADFENFRRQYGIDEDVKRIY